ncbi:MAG: thiamine-phosphate kinase [Gemmatimonadaceae bacterium]
MTGWGADGRLAQGLGPGAEFDIVRRFQARWGPLARGIGGDCAELDVGTGLRVVVSTDVSVEGVHFRADWLSPREIGYRACAAALSDLAAAAAEPLGLVIALTLPERWLGHAEAIADGVGDAVLASGAPVVGGDLSRGGELALAVTVFGESSAPLGRGGARPGDVLYLTGRLGGPAAAVAAWAGGGMPTPADRDRFAAPRPRLREARWLRRHGATAAVDISDGLAADARHLAAASGVAVWLDVERVPCVGGVAPEEAIASGEEYELLVTAPAGLDGRSFERRFGLPLTAVGRVEGARVGGAVTARVDLPRGYDHYSS